MATPTAAGIMTPLLATTGKAANGNTIYDGVEVNPNGMIEAYHIRSTYPLELGTASTKWTRVKAYAAKVKHEQKDFLTKQGIQAILE